MENQTLVFLFVCGFLMLSVSCQESMLSPPGRPSEFRTPDQLRKYLKALNDYYAIVGRPRFGRSAIKQPGTQTFGNLDSNE
ncbi:hypothetical protein ACJMK2_021439 [Sinanodonta woodiana]|uniref:Neuropeptide F n=1 Tax=Sinanodonta woodiana TaxID=1069815 RepID=A0ABD3TH17_SINWO